MSLGQIPITVLIAMSMHPLLGNGSSPMPINATRSRSGFIIFYAGVPLVWSSKLQTEVTLSSTEAKMIALSASTRELIFLVCLIKETGEITKMKIHLGNLKIYCRVYEDNKGTLELAKEYRICPRTSSKDETYQHQILAFPSTYGST